MEVMDHGVRAGPIKRMFDWWRASARDLVKIVGRARNARTRQKDWGEVGPMEPSRIWHRS